MNHKQGISVIICCFNSSKVIELTLEHLARQKIDSHINFEIVLIDNCSTDGTADIALSVWLKLQSSIEFKIIQEVRPGLSFARERGILECNFSFVLFCDDDNWLSKDYVQNAYRIISKNENIGVLGGKGIAASDGQLPYWFSTYQTGYAVGVQALESGDITERKYVWGAGMVIRKNVYLKVLSLDRPTLLTGRKGQNLSAGDDSEICRWYLLAGYNLFYSEDLVFTHYIPSSRLTKEYVKNLQEGFKVAQAILNKYDWYISWSDLSIGDKFKAVFKEFAHFITHFRAKNSPIILRLAVRGKWPFRDEQIRQIFTIKESLN